MKITKLFAVALTATALFASCSKDGGNGPANGGVIPNGEKTVARLTISQKPSGRAFVDGATATATESEVKSLTLFIFNADGAYEGKETFNVAGTDFTGAGSVKTTKTFEITTGTHYFYVAANAPAGLYVGIQEGMSTAEFAELMTAAVSSMDQLKAAANGFLMTNVGNEPVDFDLEEATADEVEDDDVNNVDIEIGRAFAKIAVEMGTTDVEDGGTFTAAQYRVINNPKNMYFMPVVESSIYKTPFYSVLADDYDEDNYFNNLVYKTADGSKATYMMENSNSTPRVGTTTTMIIRGKYTPDIANLYIADGSAVIANEAARDTDGSFWRLACLNTDGDATGFYDSKFYNAEPTGFDTDAFQKVKYSDGICYYYLPVKQEGETGAAAYNVERNQYFNVTITKINAVGVTDGPGDGLEDPDNPDNPGDEGDDQEDPGDDDPNDGGDDTDPIMPTNMRAVITVLNWTVAVQNGEL